MELVAARAESGIDTGQVGDPLAHSLDDGLDRARPHRFTTGSESAVSHAIGKEVADLEFAAESSVAVEVTEGAGDVEPLAPGLPSQESVGLGSASFRGVGCVPGVESSEEINEDCISGRRWSRVQGRGCG